MAYMLLVAGTLVTRTYCDVWMIQNGTSIESAIIGRSQTRFLKHVMQFVGMMPLISITNNLLKYGLDELRLMFRTNLTRHLYKKYLDRFTYYQMSNLDARVANPDQVLTQDVEKFCSAVIELYSNLSKPILDIALYWMKLSQSIGAQGPCLMLGYFFVSGLILTRLRRPVARMTVREQQLEGELRYVNSRLITHSEEVAFYAGGEREKRTIIGTFERLVKHLRTVLLFRFSMGFADNIIAKYVATCVGYYVVSRPFLNLDDPRHLHTSHSERTQDYYENGRMLYKMAEAVGRVVLSGREMTRLAGFTVRVSELDNVLDDLSTGKYERTMIESGLVPGSGTIKIQDKVIRFEKVPLVTPNGDVLIKELSFEVQSGVNVLVCGPNGCGKSSLFRVLGELWPLFGGTLIKPPRAQLFYIPQKPYMTLGTLRDQILYPDTRTDQMIKGVKDSDLEKYLSLVQLTPILERENGWDAVKDWMDVLSGGEKQRIAMARLFYHQPQFAILDECTSAVSVDVEASMYSYCREAGITLFTVSHRKSLWRHHEYFLHMDGRGGFQYEAITDETEQFGS